MLRRHAALLICAILSLATLGALPGRATPPALAQAPARVAFVHAAPLPGDSTVTATVDNGPAAARLGTLGYGDRLGYQAVEPGQRIFRLYGGNPSDAQLPGATPLLTAALTLAAGADYTLLAVGGVNGYSLELIAIPDLAPRPEGAVAAVRLIHAAPFAFPATAAAVDIVAENGQAVPGLLNIAFGQASAFVSVPSGTSLDLKVVPTGRPSAPTLIDLPPFALAPGEVRTLIAIGGAGGRPAAVIGADTQPRLPARLRVVQAAPLSGDQAVVQLALNGTVRWDSLRFGDVTELVELNEGPYTLALQQPGDPPGILAQVQAELRAGGEYVALIRPGADGNGVIVTVEPAGIAGAPPPSGLGLLRVYHVAPFRTDERSRVDLRDNLGQLPDPALAGIGFGQRVELALPPREYRLNYTAPGGDPVLGQVTPFTVQAGAVATVYLIGEEDGAPARAIVLADPVRQRIYLPLVRR